MTRFPGVPTKLTASNVEAMDLVRWGGNGIVGGVIATIVMTIYRMPITNSLPPTAEFWARYVGGGKPEEYPIVALFLHLGYGAAAGSVLGVLYRLFGSEAETDRSREGIGVLLGALYGLGLSVFGTRFALGRLLDMELDDTERLVFHVGHLVYGLSLGSWVASKATVREITLD